MTRASVASAEPLPEHDSETARLRRLLDLQTMFVELESLVSDCLHDLLDRFQATTGLPPF